MLWPAYVVWFQLGTYQREKQEKVLGRGGDYHCSTAENSFDYFNQVPGKLVS